ncbi:MAG: Lrp/AsnC family transcriptional regulator [Planctomycetota bacterium]|nr:Lrp/AsnC family transcriptional regulator [Planctomycetota bacterium]
MLHSPPRFSDPSLPPLDEADRKIIGILQLDGRASGRELAQQTGISEANVSRRLARLIEEKSVRVLGFVPPEFLGLQTQFMAYLRVNGSTDAAAASLLAHPQFSYISAALGVWDLIVYGTARDSIEMVSLIDHAIVADRLIHDSELHIVLEFPDAQRGHPSPIAQSEPRNIDRTDRQIIRHVQQDARMSFTDIALRTNISATSAADRLRKLMSDQVLRVITLPDPTRIAMNLSGLVNIITSIPTRELAAELAKLPELSFLSIVSGRFQIAAEFNVRDDAHFDELRMKILATPGVHWIEISIHRKLYRQHFSWGTADAE